MATLIDGKASAERRKQQVRDEVSALSGTVCLAVILVGDDPASAIYVRHKKKDCADCGIQSREYILPANTSESELFDLISSLNEDDSVNGILLQAPLPRHLDAQKFFQAISPLKDVDVFHPENVGLMSQGTPRFAPCTPAAVIALLDDYQIDPAGKHCVVVGRSNIVGKPLALLLLARHGTVSICHSRTPDLGAITRQGDILVAAAGQKGLIAGDMVKPGAVVIDVAMNRGEGKKLYGDVDFAAAEPVASYITPVPGGVGPMTRALLMMNTLTAYRLQKGSL